MIARDLVAGVDLLCLDAGNTVIFLDHARMAAIAARNGIVATAEALVASEGRAKRRADSATLVDPTWPHRNAPGAVGWGKMCATILVEAGAEESRAADMLEPLWREHTELNLWSLVPEGLIASLTQYRAHGGKVAIVSNSEGGLEALFERLALRAVVDLVLDSGKLGVEKPDPRIFEAAFRELGVPAARALHLGDTFATDVLGARAAGIRVALIDPYGHYAGVHEGVPRVESAAAVARALCELRRQPATHAS